MAKAKKRRSKRKPVNREERHAATPETVAKLAERARINGGHACPLQAMLAAGTMQPEQYEAALQIWDANDALVKGLKAGSVDVDKIANAHGGLSDGKARLVQIYLQWASELAGRFYLTSGIVLGWINDDAPGERMTNNAQRHMLTKACDHWNKIKRDHGRESRVECYQADRLAQREMVAA